MVHMKRLKLFFKSIMGVGYFNQNKRHKKNPKEEEKIFHVTSASLMKRYNYQFLI